MLEIITQNETLVVDSRLIADELGIEHRALRQTVEKYLTDLEDFGVVSLKEDKPLKGSQGGRPERVYYLNEDQLKFIISKSRNGLATDSINKFKEMGFDFSSFLYTSKKRKKKKEVQYKRDLAKQLNGKVEVKTLAGTIDILTMTEIIEVKEVKAWKHALGQVLVYGHYYPSHQKRIHLYGETQDSFLKMICSHCKKFNVTVTWEA